MVFASFVSAGGVRCRGSFWKENPGMHRRAGAADAELGAYYPQILGPRPFQGLLLIFGKLSRWDKSTWLSAGLRPYRAYKSIIFLRKKKD
jgi:hypothetical protein